ncbi:hypothetical protein NBRC116583_28840 [Arenicella sp. 4NH20-0111]|uniref:hypothetical protein n=1 Tax=Arenicella sp. 4NH20-0111 TaxID=3127648 RepID=UPI00310690F9
MAAKETAKKTSAKKVTTKKTPVKKASVKAKKEVIEAVDAVENVVETAAESVIAKVSKNVEQAQDVAKNVWYAYLGAAGFAVEEVTSRATKVTEEVQSRYNKLNKDGQDFVLDLVSRGEKVQDEAETRLKEGRASIEEKIDEATSKVFQVVDVKARWEDLSDRLEGLREGLKKSA